MAPVGGSHPRPLPAGPKESPPASPIATGDGSPRSVPQLHGPISGSQEFGVPGGGRMPLSPPRPCWEEESAQRCHRCHRRFCFCTEREADGFAPRRRHGTSLPVFPPNAGTSPVPLRGESCTHRALTSARHRHRPGTMHVPTEHRDGRGASLLLLLAGDGDRGQSFTEGPAGSLARRAGSSPSLSGPLPSPSKSFIGPLLGSLLRS